MDAVTARLNAALLWLVRTHLRTTEFLRLAPFTMQERTCATLLADLEVHPRVIMRIRRHIDVSMTLEIYSNASPMATSEAQRRLGGAPSKSRSKFGFVAALAVFCCCTGTKAGPHQF